MKKVLCLLVVIGLLLTFVGCQTGSTTTSPGQTTAPGVTTTSQSQTTTPGEMEYKGELPLTEEKKTLVFATHEGHAANMAPPSNDLPVYKRIEELTNVNIQWETTPAQTYGEVMAARVASGQSLPDIFVGNFAHNPEKLETDGIIIDQTEMLEKYGYYSKMFFDDPASAYWRLIMTSPNGKFYGFTSTVLTNTLSIGYMTNFEWLEKGGLDVPDTTEELYDVLVYFRDNDMNGNGNTDDEVPLSGPGLGNMLYISNSFGLEMYVAGDGYRPDSDGKVYAEWISPQYKAYLAYVNRLYTDKLLDQNIMTANYQIMSEYATNDTVGIILWWTTFCQTFSSMNPLANDASGDTPVYKPIPPVKGPDGHQYNLKRFTSGGDTMYISKSCKEPVLAFKWIDFMFNSPDALETQIWGIEGTTFKRDGDQRTHIREEGVDWAQTLNEIGGGQPPRAHQQLLDGWRVWLLPWLEAENEKIQPYYKMPATMAIPWAEAESQRLTAVKTDIDTYIAEMRSKFILGQEPLSKFDDYVSVLKGMGIDEVVEIYQKRHDRLLEWTDGWDW